MKTYTHTGVLIGDARAPRPVRVYLRETTNFWVDTAQRKFRKTTGWGIGDWPIYHLDLKTVTVLETSVRK